MKSNRKIKKVFNTQSYIYAIHEVGHFIVRSILRPNVIFSIKLEQLKDNQYEGIVKRADGKENDDSDEVKAFVSIAGIIAEKFNSETWLLESKKDFFSGVTHLSGDFNIFHLAKINLQDGLCAANDLRDFFDFVALYVKDIFDSFGFKKMQSIAKGLKFDETTIMESIVSSYKLDFKDVAKKEIDFVLIQSHHI